MAKRQSEIERVGFKITNGKRFKQGEFCKQTQLVTFKDHLTGQDTFVECAARIKLNHHGITNRNCVIDKDTGTIYDTDIEAGPHCFFNCPALLARNLPEGWSERDRTRRIMGTATEDLCKLPGYRKTLTDSKN